MKLMLDTNTLVWIGAGSEKLSTKARTALFDAEHELCISAITAFDFADLHAWARFPSSIELGLLQAKLHLTVLDYPAALWVDAVRLPDIHRDPVDRMMIAHARLLGAAIVTADQTVARYPVETIW